MSQPVTSTSPLELISSVHVCEPRLGWGPAPTLNVCRFIRCWWGLESKWSWQNPNWTPVSIFLEIMLCLIALLLILSISLLSTESRQISQTGFAQLFANVSSWPISPVKSNPHTHPHTHSFRTTDPLTNPWLLIYPKCYPQFLNALHSCTLVSGYPSVIWHAKERHISEIWHVLENSMLWLILQQAHKWNNCVSLHIAFDRLTRCLGQFLRTGKYHHRFCRIIIK